MVTGQIEPCIRGNSKALNHTQYLFSNSKRCKNTRIIHHTHLLLTKFGKNFVTVNRWRQNCSQNWTVDRENLGTRLSCLSCFRLLEQRMQWLNCRRFYSFHGEILSKNIARTARSKLDGQHTLFGVYLQTWADLNLLNFPIKMHYRYELTSTEVSMF